LQRLSVDNGERSLPFLGDANPAAVWRCRNPVDRLDPRDLVAGSMMETVSLALLVWTIRSFDCCAAAKENDTVHRRTPAKAASPSRNACLLVIFVILLFNDQLPS
jgi:hypothetical protein